jgi:hypothetical protein
MVYYPSWNINDNHNGLMKSGKRREGGLISGANE